MRNYSVALQVSNNHLRPFFPAAMPEWTGNLLKKAWHQQSSDRPTALEILRELESKEKEGNTFI